MNRPDDETTTIDIYSEAAHAVQLAIIRAESGGQTKHLRKALNHINDALFLLKASLIHESYP